MAHKLSSSPPPLSQYTRGVLLGKGVSAKDGGGVYSGRDNDTSEEVAIKYMKVGAMEPFEFKQVERELCNVRSALDVPGFVRFRRALYLPGWLVIVMDLCGPALLDWINKLWLREGASSRRVGQKAQRDDGDKGSTEESLIRGVVVQVLHTVTALHASGTGPRDIKARRHAAHCVLTPSRRAALRYEPQRQEV